MTSPDPATAPNRVPDLALLSLPARSSPHSAALPGIG